MENFFSVDVEGGDQVGKGDAVKNLALELASEKYDVLVAPFPCYASPLGNAVRQVLKEDLFEEFGLDDIESVSSKMALFSLNRLEILNGLLTEREGKVFVFDRGPFSNALTIGYALVKGLDREYEQELVQEALSLDSYFRKQMKTDGCVIRLFNESNSWSKSREDGDLHESKDVQDISDRIYSIFGEEIGENWVEILSKSSTGWRERSDIAKDCLTAVSERLQLVPTSSSSEPKYLEIGKILGELYKGSKIDQGALNKLQESLFLNDKGGMYESSVLVAQNIVDTVKDIEWYNEEIRGEVEKILTKYEGILYLLEKIYGEEFVIKFLKSVKP